MLRSYHPTLSIYTHSLKCIFPTFFVEKEAYTVSTMNALPKCEANYVSLTPITFLKRASMVYGDRISIIYEGVHFTWHQTYERCRRLASSLRSLNVGKNHVVSILSLQIILHGV